MPEANQTYNRTATGGWDLIASEGDLEITAKQVDALFGGAA